MSYSFCRRSISFTLQYYMISSSYSPYFHCRYLYRIRCHRKIYSTQNCRPLFLTYIEIGNNHQLRFSLSYKNTTLSKYIYQFNIWYSCICDFSNCSLTDRYGTNEIDCVLVSAVDGLYYFLIKIMPLRISRNTLMGGGGM